MGFLASWWERMPTKQIGTALAVIVVIGVIGVQWPGPQRIGVGVTLPFKPTGEVWG